MKNLAARLWLCLVVATLATASFGCVNKERRSQRAAEIRKREAFARDVAVDAGSGRALGVSSRDDVLFEEGFSVISYDPPDDYRNHAFRWMGQRGHLRVHSHGDRPMILRLTGWLHEKVIRSKAVVTIYLDGVRVHDTGAVQDGAWGTETVIPAAMLRNAGWLDVVINVSAVAFHWSEPPDLRVVVLTGIAWYEQGT